MKSTIDIAGLVKERNNLRKALEAMDNLLAALGVDLSTLDEEGGTQSMISALKSVAAEMKSNITKGTVLDALRRSYPQLSPNPQSVTAALAKLTQGDDPYLFIERRGAGNQATLYTIYPTKSIKLLPAQMKALFAPKRTHGTGGWQSLFKRLQQRVDRESGEIILDEKIMSAMRHYFFNYGVGGWQNYLKRIFGSHIPEVFRKTQMSDPAGDDFLL